jgi:hypothetical protein
MRAHPSAWLRGYNMHSLWAGRNKLAFIRLDRAKRIYRWEAGTLAGEAASLEQAKSAVRTALRAQAGQLVLFGAAP